MIWLPEAIAAACRSDADLHYPNESGGAFMGYESAGSIVVTMMVGGGPAALRMRTAYAPDVDWQNACIAEHYARSGRRDEYLGDWHSHPDTDRALLSSDDRAVLKKIIKTPAARAPRPIMCVLTGTRGDWRPFGWRATLEPRRLFGSRLLIEEADLRIFDSAAG